MTLGTAKITPLDEKNGWLRCQFDGVSALVDLRLVERGGRIRVVALRLDDDDGINATTLRRIPLGAIETWFNTRVERLAEAVRTPERIARAIHDAPGTPADAIRAERERVRAAKASARKLKVPKRQPYGDGFYSAVAAVYRECSEAGLAPGATLAKAKSVPVTQAHGWIRTARNRGVLSKGQRGKTA